MIFFFSSSLLFLSIYFKEICTFSSRPYLDYDIKSKVVEDMKKRTNNRYLSVGHDVNLKSDFKNLKS